MSAAPYRWCFPFRHHWVTDWDAIRRWFEEHPSPGGVRGSFERCTECGKRRIV